MRVKCNYCGNMIDETSKKCENCGAPNERLKRVGDGVPKTIEELKEWYKDHNLPEPEVTRFFIGENYEEPKAFGIYKKEDGNFVVYKNKDDGSRSIRYEGTDEVYAVNELYLKLKDEIQNQKNINIEKQTNKNNNGSKMKISLMLVIVIIFITCFILAFIQVSYESNNGYYNYNDTEYYKKNGYWYIYSNDSWTEIDSSGLDKDFRDNYKDYYEGSDYNSTDFDGQDIKDSYVSNSWESSSDTSSSDWDSDSSWDSSDSWDSGSTDWGSDW